uniref:uncharacterized protein LOC718434 n=1 Tax=Macaca mulatta TaxID=9544 RepID=UPI0010A25E1E|nr:uncharacterized protein LOC718434 [Macaca mulatta]
MGCGARVCQAPSPILKLYSENSALYSSTTLLEDGRFCQYPAHGTGGKADTWSAARGRASAPTANHTHGHRLLSSNTEDKGADWCKRRCGTCFLYICFGSSKKAFN